MKYKKKILFRKMQSKMIRRGRTTEEEGLINRSAPTITAYYLSSRSLPKDIAV